MGAGPGENLSGVKRKKNRGKGSKKLYEMGRARESKTRNRRGLKRKRAGTS